MVELEPQRKGRRGTDESDTEFRRAVRQELLEFGLQGWPRAPLALDFGFATTLRQPAGIEAYPKHYQDLLEPGERDDDEAPFLYRDDRQIKLLFVTCWHGWGRDRPPHIALTCRPRRHAIADLEAAARLGFLDDHNNDDDHRVDDVSDRRYDAQYAATAPLRPDEGHRSFAEWNAQYAAHEAHRAPQDGLVHANDRHLARLLVSRASSLITRRPDPLWRSMTRLGLPHDHELFKTLGATGRGRRLLDMLIQIALPALPAAKGEGDRFRETVRAACQKFVDRHTYLRPLLVPLRITLLVVPPAQGKDLDNIVLNVIRAVNTVFEPQPEPWLLTPSLAQADTDESRCENALRRSRQMAQVGVTSYQVVELARMHDEPSAGTLTMVLGHGDILASTWEEAADFVDGRLERDD